MLEILTGEASKGYKNKTSEIELSKTMDKYALLNRFHNGRWLQVYMFSFMYVDPKTMPVEDCFPATKIFVDEYKKMSTQGPVPKHWIGFSYIHSEYY